MYMCRFAIHLLYLWSRLGLFMHRFICERVGEWMIRESAEHIFKSTGLVVERPGFKSPISHEIICLWINHIICFMGGERPLYITLSS